MSDRVGEDPPREGPDRGGEDLRRLDEAHRAAGLLAGRLGVAIASPSGPMLPKRPIPIGSTRSCSTRGDEQPRGPGVHDVETRAVTATPLWP